MLLEAIAGSTEHGAGVTFLLDIPEANETPLKLQLQEHVVSDLTLTAIGPVFE